MYNFSVFRSRNASKTEVTPSIYTVENPEDGHMNDR
jgi:hypothetical protein